MFVSLSFSFSSSIFVLTSKRKGIRSFDVVVEGEGREAPSLPFPGGHPGEGSRGGSRGRVAGGVAGGSRGGPGVRKLGTSRGNGRKPSQY